jgi:hypothetical protein
MIKNSSERLTTPAPAIEDSLGYSFVDNKLLTLYSTICDINSRCRVQQNQLKEVNKDDYLRKPVHIGQLIETIKREYFAKDCKDTCDEEGSASDKRQKTKLMR